MLTIKKPAELAEEIVKIGICGLIDTEDGVFTFFTNTDGTMRIIYPLSNRDEINDVINAYSNALIYELEKLSGCTWIIT